MNEREEELVFNLEQLPSELEGEDRGVEGACEVHGDGRRSWREGADAALTRLCSAYEEATSNYPEETFWCDGTSFGTYERNTERGVGLLQEGQSMDRVWYDSDSGTAYRPFWYPRSPPEWCYRLRDCDGVFPPMDSVWEEISGVSGLDQSEDNNSQFCLRDLLDELEREDRESRLEHSDDITRREWNRQD